MYPFDVGYYLGVFSRSGCAKITKACREGIMSSWDLISSAILAIFGLAGLMPALFSDITAWLKSLPKRAISTIGIIIAIMAVVAWAANWKARNDDKADSDQKYERSIGANNFPYFVPDFSNGLTPDGRVFIRIAINKPWTVPEVAMYLHLLKTQGNASDPLYRDASTSISVSEPYISQWGTPIKWALPFENYRVEINTKGEAWRQFLYLYTDDGVPTFRTIVRRRDDPTIVFDSGIVRATNK